MMLKILISLAATLLFGLSSVQAQDYPNRSVTLVVPAAPGGPTDALARLLSEQLKVAFGQNVLVENRGGANGSIGVASVARAPADGYQLLLSVDGPITTLQAMMPTIPYDSLKDLMPVAIVGDGGDVVLAVPASSPARDARQLADLLRKDPASSNYVSSGAGFPSHLVGELYKREARFEAQHVPVRGAGAAMIELLSERYSFSFPPASVAAPHARAGKIRVLAVAAGKRNPIFPEVPTLAEAGYAVSPPGFWIALYAPAATPVAIVEKLGTAVRLATRSVEFAELLKRQGLIASTSTTPQIQERMRSETEFWNRSIRQLDIKTE